MTERTYPAALRRVVDGDTIDVTVDLGFQVHTEVRLRLKDINCPERGQPGYAEATAATALWLASAAVAAESLERWPLLIETWRTQDVYSRWLAIVHPAGQPVPSLNDWLVASGHAVADVYPKPRKDTP